MRSRIDEREDGGDDAAGEIDQAGANEVADAFHVAHDAGDEHAGFVGVVVGDGQAADVRLHLAAQFGDHSLRRFGEKLGEANRSEPLHDGGGEHGQNERLQHRHLMVDHDVVEQEFRGSGQDQSRDAIDEHEHKAEREDAAARLEQGNDFGSELPGALVVGRLPRVVRCARARAAEPASNAGGRFSVGMRGRKVAIAMRSRRSPRGRGSGRRGFALRVRELFRVAQVESCCRAAAAEGRVPRAARDFAAARVRKAQGIVPSKFTPRRRNG